jgi:hypothetical protein
MHIKYIECGLDWTGSWQRPMMDSSENGNEQLDSMDLLTRWTTVSFSGRSLEIFLVSRAMMDDIRKYLQCGILFTSHRKLLFRTLGFRGGCDSSVGIATGYGLESRVSIPGMSKRLFSSPQRPDRLWTPPKPRIPGAKAAGAWSWPLTSI